MFVSCTAADLFIFTCPYYHGRVIMLATNLQ